MVTMFAVAGYRVYPVYPVHQVELGRRDVTVAMGHQEHSDLKAELGEGEALARRDLKENKVLEASREHGALLVLVLMLTGKSALGKI